MSEHLENVAAEFVAYWERAGGCGMCGGLPHADTCFVLRFRRILEAAAQEAETPRQSTRTTTCPACDEPSNVVPGWCALCRISYALPPRPATTEER